MSILSENETKKMDLSEARKKYCYKRSKTALTRRMDTANDASLKVHNDSEKDVRVHSNDTDESD